MLHLAIECLCDPAISGHVHANNFVTPLQAGVVYFLALAATGLIAYAVFRYRMRHRPKPWDLARQRGGLRPATAADCPYCHQPFVSLQTEPAIRCPGCDVKMHAECCQEHGGCATYGCWHRPQQDTRPLDERVAEALAPPPGKVAE